MATSYITGGKVPPKSGGYGLNNDSSECSLDRAGKGTGNPPYGGEKRGAGGTGSSGNVSNK